MPTETIVTIIGSVGTIAAGFGAFLKVFIMGRIDDLKSDVKELKGNVAVVVSKLEECQEDHAVSRERAARAESALSIVGRELRPEVQEKIRSLLDDATQIEHGR